LEGEEEKVNLFPLGGKEAGGKLRLKQTKSEEKKRREIPIGEHNKVQPGVLNRLKRDEKERKRDGP